MKICLSTRETIWGGGEVFLRDLGEELLSRGHRVVWRVEEVSELAKRRPGGELIDRRMPANYDLLIANDFRSLWQALLLDGFRRRVFVGHGSWQFSPLRVRLLRSSGTKTFVVSSTVASAALSHGFEHGPEILPLGPGVWREKPEINLKRFVNQTVENLTIGNVARLDPIKRLPLFARAISELGARGVLVVPTPADDDEAELCRYLKSLEHIDLRVGASVAELWKDIDVFLSTSAAESLGLAHLEALQSGVPVISTAAGGPGDYLVGDLRAGWIPDSKDDELAQGILASLNAIGQSDRYWDDANRVLADRGISRCADALLGI